MVGSSDVQCTLCGSINWKSKYALDGLNVKKCRQCSLVCLSRLPTKDELQSMYSATYFQERRDYFFDNPVAAHSHLIPNETIRDFSRGLELLKRFRTKGKLLDVGCGVGIFMSMAENEGWETFGVDLSDYSVEMAKKQFGLNVFSGELREAGFPEKHFEVITLWDTFEHLVNPCEQLQQIRYLLKDDGLVLINIPNEESLLRILASIIFTASFGKIAYPVRKLYHQYHLFYYSLETIQRMMEENGYEILHREGKRIPVEKGRKTSIEKTIVMGISLVEKLIGKEYELLVIARKKKV